MAWTPKKITFFIDGRETRSLTNVNGIGVNQISSTSARLIANLATIGSAAPTDWTNNQTSMYVDYIRVYKPAAGSNSYPAYKTDEAWATSQLEQYPASQVTTTQNCISGTADGKVYFSGPDNILRRYTPSTLTPSTYVYEPVIQNGGGAGSERVHGDVVAGDTQNSQVFYKGQDNRVQYFFLDGNNQWYHSWADWGWNSNDNTSLISPYACALAVVPGQGNRLLFYRGMDNHVHKLEFTGASTRNGWTHTILPYGGRRGSTAAPNVDGDLIMWNNFVVYRGAGGQLNYYAQNTNGNYVNYTLGGSVSSGIGTLVGLDDGIYYRGSDNYIYYARYNNSSQQWTTGQLSTDFPIGGTLIGQGQRLFYRGTDDKMQTYYLDNNGWQHDWLSSWGSYSAATTLHEDNFTLGGIGPKGNLPRLFFKNPSGYVGKFEYSFSEVLDPACQDFTTLPVVYRPATPAAPSQTVAQEERFALTPNPTTEAVVLHCPQAVAGAAISVYNTTGQQVLSSVVSASGATTLATQALASGLYVVRISKAAKVTSLKLVIGAH